MDFHIELVQTSCGFGVPLFKFQQERDDMDKWLDSKNDQDIKEYWGGKMPSVWTACLLTFLDQNMNEENPIESKPKAEGSVDDHIGRIEWVDLQRGQCGAKQRFHCKVIGWKSADVEMGTYSDFNLNLPGSGETLAGICHRTGHECQPACPVADVCQSR